MVLVRVIQGPGQWTLYPSPGHTVFMESAPFEGSRIEFPVTFDLKFIYEAAAASTINADLLAVFARRSVPCTSIEAKDGKPGARYGRLAARVTFTSLEQLRATYEDLGKLKYVKGLI